MTKRSAMVIAGGLVTALLSGLVALAINMGILGAAGAPQGPGHLGSKPIVRTIVQTVDDRTHASAPTRTVVIPRPPSSVGGAGSAGESEQEHEFGPGDDD